MHSRPERIIGRLGVLATLAGILVITLGPAWLVADGLEAVLRVLARAGLPTDAGRVEPLANLAIFVPLGFFLGLAVRPRAWPAAALAGIVLSVAVELAQTGIPGRVPDPHDVANNAAGDLAGLLVAMVVVGVLRLTGALQRS